MANTTDIIITGNISTGQKIICFDAYGTSEKYFSIDDINDIISAFNTDLDCDKATMIIDCDTYESKNGIYFFDKEN